MALPVLADVGGATSYLIPATLLNGYSVCGSCLNTSSAEHRVCIESKSKTQTFSIHVDFMFFNDLHEIFGGGGGGGGVR